MSPTSLSLVNQKLTHARLLLVQLDAAGSSSLLEGALQEAVAGQLVCAYRHHLRELAENYRVKFPDPITTETQLISALGDLDKAPAEAQELAELRYQKDSWLSQLHQVYDSLWALPQGPKPGRESAGLIAVVSLDHSESPSLNTGELKRWYKELVELIQRHRETSVEW